MVEAVAKVIYAEHYGWTDPWAKIQGSVRTECRALATSILTTMGLLPGDKGK